MIAAVAARLQPQGPERGAAEALFGHPQHGTIIILRLVSHDMASKHEDAPSMHATEQASPQLNGRAALSMNVTKTQPQGQSLQTPMFGRVAARGSLSCEQNTKAIERGSIYCSTMPGERSICHLSTSPQSWIDGPALPTAVLSLRLRLVWTVCAIMQGAGCIVMVQDVMGLLSVYSYLFVATSAPWASLDLHHPMPIGNEQASRAKWTGSAVHECSGDAAARAEAANAPRLDGW